MNKIPDGAAALIGAKATSRLNGSGVFPTPTPGEIVRVTATRVVVKHSYRHNGHITEREQSYRVSDGRETGANTKERCPVYRILEDRDLDLIRRAYGLSPLRAHLEQGLSM